MCLLFFALHFHIGICVCCSSLYIFIQGYVFPVLPLHFYIGICIFVNCVQQFTLLWVRDFPFFFRVYGFDFLFFPFIGLWISCSSLRIFIQGHVFSVLPFTFLYRVMYFLFFPLHFHIGSCDLCSSFYIFLQGYLFPVHPFTFSYGDMCFLFFLLHFHIRICVSSTNRRA